MASTVLMAAVLVAAVMIELVAAAATAAATATVTAMVMATAAAAVTLVSNATATLTCGQQSEASRDFLFVTHFLGGRPPRPLRTDSYTILPNFGRN